MTSSRSIALAAALLAVTGCPGPDQWRVVHQNRGAALISIWGASGKDVWAVGGDLADGQGPEVLRYDGRVWKRLATGASGDLWWVYGFSGGPVFLGGKGGLLLRYDQGQFEKMSVPGTQTVFGVWGASPSDVWAVGGDGLSNAFAWRFDGARWNDVALPAGVLANHSLFKVWGAGTDDVWLVGSGGVSLHWDGAALAKVDTGTQRTLFTVHAAGGRFAAVGGFGKSVVLENDGAGWKDVSPVDAKQAIGVHLTAQGGFAVGMNGSVLRRDASGWAVEDTRLDVYDDLHAVWVDPTSSEAWAVGGRVAIAPLIRGVLIHRGQSAPSSKVE